MKRRVVFSTFLTICLIVAGCNRHSATNNAQVAALFHATREGNTDMVRSLLAAPGVDVNVTDESGSTPLLEAARYGHDNICRMLIAADVVMTVTGSFEKRCASALVRDINIDARRGE